MASAQDNMICAVCRNVYTSPRFLPCYHSFCRMCLEELAKRHGNDINCPTCRAPAEIPPGGVSALQVNFYFTEEVLEQARSEGSHSMCPVHTIKRLVFYCTECEKAICTRCKLTKHEGHVTEDLSEAVARCKKTIEHELGRLGDSLKCMAEKTERFERSENYAQKKQVALVEQIQDRHDVIVAMAGAYRDQAMRKLQKMSESLGKEFGTKTQRVKDEINSILQLEERARRALSSACDTEVLEVEREMTRGEGSAERLTELKAGWPSMIYLPGLHGDFTNDIENCIKRYIGSPVKLTAQIDSYFRFFCVDRCEDRECREVHALRQLEDERIEVFYGGTGGDFSKERSASFKPYSSKRLDEHEYGKRVTCFTRKDHILEWKDSEKRTFVSKNESRYSIYQNCTTGECCIRSIRFKQKEGKKTWCFGPPLIYPEVNMIHNFDSKEEGMLFAVIDEDKDESSDNESGKKNEEKENKERSRRVVRLYSNKSDDPVAIYRPPKQPFFPTDVCFYGKDLLLIADWMNDSVHLTTITDEKLTFVRYLTCSGYVVRPTALNLDKNGHLLIGCGGGSIFKHFNPNF